MVFWRVAVGVRIQNAVQKAPRLAKRFFSEEIISDGAPKNPIQELYEKKTTVGFGAAFLGFGIAFLTINERRDVRQEQWTEEGRKACISLDISKNPTKLDPRLNEHLVCLSGVVKAIEPFPHDTDFEIKCTEALRMRRLSEMFQIHEEKHTKTWKDKEGNERKTVTYSHHYGWYDSHQDVMHHPQGLTNPSFPHEISSSSESPQGNSFEASAVRVENTGTILKSDMVHMLRDFIPLKLDNKTVADNGTRMKQIGNGFQLAKMMGDKDILYSCNGTHSPSPDHPKLGDMRIVYTYIPQDTYTIAAQWRQDPDPEGSLTAYKDALKKHELSNMAEIKVTDEVQELCNKVGYGSFIIPTHIIDLAEDVLMNALPIQVGYIKRGTQSKDAVFANIKKADTENSIGARILGGLLVILGVYSMISPLSAIAPSLVNAGAVSIGCSIAVKTIDEARQQIGAKAVDDNTMKVLRHHAQSSKEDMKHVGDVFNSNPALKINSNNNSSSNNNNNNSNKINEAPVTVVSASGAPPGAAAHFCGNCGTKLSSGAKFCGGCGTKLN